MAQRKVFVIWTNPLVHESVRLLLKHPEVAWVGSGSSLADAREDILRLGPDTIIIEETESSSAMAIMEIFKFSPFCGRIISLNLDNNQLRVYHREERTVAKADDLLEAILRDS